jgi:hypothetical protein
MNRGHAAHLAATAAHTELSCSKNRGHIPPDIRDRMQRIARLAEALTRPANGIGEPVFSVLESIRIGRSRNVPEVCSGDEQENDTAV